MPVGVEVLRDLDRAAAIEWLITDGRGGFAMGTAAGMNTRRYHGWCVSLRPPVERYVLVSRLEETVEGFALATNQYPGAIHPTGYSKLVRFERSPCPTWTWELDGLVLTKQLFLVEGSLCVRYRASRPVEIRVRPMLAYRDYHSLQHAGDARPPFGLPALRVSEAVSAEGQGWYFANEYRVEQQRGLDFREDLWCMGTVALKVATESTVVFSLGDPPANPQPRAETPEELFIVMRADARPTIIAGYPWFTDWGRDSMIAMRGLKAPRDVLDAFLEHLNQGLIPNRFPDRGETPEYNTSDATLWMFENADASFFERGREIIAWHEKGTHFDLHVNPADGLLINGPQTTWMDAVVNGRPVTPRAGKCVEINALWFNALKRMEGWARELGRAEIADGMAARAQRVAGAFRRTFWNPSRGYLDDVAGDGSLRPNQVLAASLTHSPLSVAEMQSMLRVVEARLLTPYGLRTLGPSEPGYVGRYDGDPASRDGGYHQGTVWPWLIGPYVDAQLAAHGDAAKPKCRVAIATLLKVLEETGSIPEVYDGDAPHRPGGTPAQAWSVAEVLRASARLESAEPRSAQR